MSVSLPLDEYLPTPDEQERIGRAQAVLEVACLRRLGVSWSGPSETELLVGKAFFASTRAGRFGLVDEQQAAVHGYHPPPWSLWNLRRHGADESGHHSRHPEEPPEVKKVLFGVVRSVNGSPVPAGGCRRESAGRLTGGAVTGDPMLLTNLTQEAKQRAEADPRARAVYAAWRSCMTASGYRYETPADAAGDRRWTGPRQPTKQEIDTATADVRCKNEVGLLTTLAAVTAEHQRALIHANAAEFGRLKLLRQRQVTAAAQILQNPSAQAT